MIQSTMRDSAWQLLQNADIISESSSSMMKTANVPKPVACQGTAETHFRKAGEQNTVETPTTYRPLEARDTVKA